MRIGMILDDSFPPDPRIENEAETLINNGHQVFLFCLDFNGIASEELYNKIHVKRYKASIFIYKLSALAYTIPLYRLLLQRKISNFIKFNKIEILHVHDIRIAETVFQVNKKFKLKVVLDLHENRPEIMKFYPHLNKFPGKYLIDIDRWKINEEKYVKLADKVIVVTEEAKDELFKRTHKNNEDIAVVTNTVSRNFFTDFILDEEIINKYSKDFVLLYIGDTGDRRGLQTAIAAVSLLKERIINVKLVIVGAINNQNLLELVNGLILNGYVDFVGWKHQKYFASYISISKICISPLHRNIHHNTTYANKLFQYMSFGKPVLVSNATAQKNLIERTHSGLVHEEKNAADFAEKVIELYQDKVLANQLGANGKRFVEEEFCWEKVSGNLVKLYQDLA